jgi:hypothetical protein
MLSDMSIAQPMTTDEFDGFAPVAMTGGTANQATPSTIS